MIYDKRRAKQLARKRESVKRLARRWARTNGADGCARKLGFATGAFRKDLAAAYAENLPAPLRQAAHEGAMLGFIDHDVGGPGWELES